MCSIFIAHKLGVSRPTASEHLRILADAGLIESKRIRPWIFYRRNEEQIARVKRALASDW